MLAGIKAMAVLLLAALLLSLTVFGGSAESAVEPFPNLSYAQAVAFYHLESGRMMGSKNETEKVPAGTSLRILSGLLFCEKFETQLATTVKITDEMIEGAKGYYGYGMKAGDWFTVEQLLYLSLCGGYNDAYYALAYLSGDGDVSAFVRRMNDRAKEIGAVNTTVTDPSGILDTSFTSVADLLLIAQVNIQNALYMKISGSPAYDLNGSRRIENRNALISSAQEGGRYYNSKCRGLTAGNTTLGGWTIVSMSQNENDRYLCVVLGGKVGQDESAQKYGYTIVNRMIDWGYSNYRYLETLSPESDLFTISVRSTDVADRVRIGVKESLSFYLPADAVVGETVHFSVRLIHEELDAPVKAGTHVGYVAVIYRDEVLGTAMLYTAEDVERSGFIGGLMRVKRLTESRAACAGLIFFCVLMLAWWLGEYLIRRARRHKWDRYFSEKIDASETLLKK